MKHLLALLLFASGCQNLPIKPMNSSKETELDHLNYLEDIQGSKALEFAVKNNAYSNERLKSDKRFKSAYDEIFKIVSAKDKLPVFNIMNNEIYNFWQDDVHIKGLLRKSSVEAFNHKKPNWTSILNIDLLAKTEQKNWVYKGITCLEPKFETCMISLSDGGRDAVVMREFNLHSKSFVKNGFSIPESKSSLAWVDHDTLLVGDASDDSPLSPAGYPLQIKVLKRGSALKDSEVIFQTGKNSVAADVGAFLSDGERYVYVGNQISFFEAEVFILDFNNLKLLRIPIPRTANFEGIFQGQILFSNRDAFLDFSAGSLISTPIKDLSSFKPAFYPVFQPSQTSFYEQSARSKNTLYIEVLNDVKKEVFKSHFNGQNWELTPVTLKKEMPGNVSIATMDQGSKHVYFSYSDSLTPVSVYYRNESGQKEFQNILQAPARFDGSAFKIEQFKTKSSDGTVIPYFVVSSKKLALNSKNPTLLYAYGGFEIPMTQAYLGSTGKVWLEKGGVYVLANIRGGGEYGPVWHQAALRENRQRAFNDFYAVAEDLIKRNITSPHHLGIKGGSNGGLLTSVAFTQRPELFNAVISEVPLANMLEYHHWLAGASWMEEYGNPDDPKMREYLAGYSPLHNLKKEKAYPEVFFLTSTLDDRVSPAHARQMVARMQELGHPVLYNENTDGGHGRATNMKDLAEYLALEFTYLYQKLF